MPASKKLHNALVPFAAQNLSEDQIDQLCNILKEDNIRFDKTRFKSAVTESISRHFDPISN